MGFIGRNSAYSIQYNKTASERFWLEINATSNPSKPIIVIMKNPSATCINMAHGTCTISGYSQLKRCRIDRTTGKVYRRLKKNFDKIIILNLFSIYSTATATINSAPGNITTNDTEITNILNKYFDSPVICAWGDNSQISPITYRLRVQAIRHIINHRFLLQYDKKTQLFIPYVFGMSYPKHGLTWT